jgi:hypothetical protein
MVIMENANIDLKKEQLACRTHQEVNPLPAINWKQGRTPGRQTN